MNERSFAVLFGICLVGMATSFWQCWPVALEISDAPFVCPAVDPEYPTVNLPFDLREPNWAPNNYGSCVHATNIMLLRWQGRHNTAKWWRENHWGGEYSYTFEDKLKAAPIRYASTYDNEGDVTFLDWACETRRGCGITVMGGRHMVALVHLDDEWAAILDNNSITEFIWVPRDKLIAEWLDSGGWAVTPLYSPVPPLPTFP